MAQSGLNPAATVEVLYDGKAQLGEGPFFEPETNQLLWVDIDAYTINFLNMEGTVNRSIKLSDRVGAVIPIEGSSNLLAATGTKLCIVDRQTGAILEELVQVEKDKPNNRFNDAKCDASGRLWVGTMALETEPAKLPLKQGNLYNYTAGKITHCIPDVSISNGLGWSLDNSTMYYIDSIPKSVFSFNFNLADGTITNRSVCVNFGSDDTLGIPDGMCTDIEGRLWVAAFGKGCVSCWDPKTGDELLRLKMPGAKNITSCCFGGPDFSWLFVTSATYGVKDLSAQPHAGGVFVIKNLGTKGLPANRFKP